MKNEQIALFPVRMTKTLMVRLTPEEMDKLNTICQAYQLTHSKAIRRFINSEFDTLNGNPELKKMLKKLGDVAKFMKTFGD